jgi:arsenite methyltransferase
MKPDYGIDAPNVVRNLFVFALILDILTGLSFLIQSSLWFWIVFLYAFSSGLALFITGCWMLYGIKITKPKIVLAMIQNLELKGHEQVLDLGCGRGLLLCKVAHLFPKAEHMESIYGPPRINLEILWKQLFKMQIEKG